MYFSYNQASLWEGKLSWNGGLKKVDLNESWTNACCNMLQWDIFQDVANLPWDSLQIFPPLPTWYNVLLNVSVAGNHYANIPFRDMIAWIVHQSVDGMYVPGNTWHFYTFFILSRKLRPLFHNRNDEFSGPQFLTFVTYRRGYVCEVQVRQWKFYMMGPKTFLLKVFCLYIQYLFCLIQFEILTLNGVIMIKQTPATT